MSDAEISWLSWSCKIAAPGARDMSAEDDAKLRQAIARAFKRVTGVPCEVLISGFGDVRLNKPVQRRRAREPSSAAPGVLDDQPRHKLAVKGDTQMDFFA